MALQVTSPTAAPAALPPARLVAIRAGAGGVELQSHQADWVQHYKGTAAAGRVRAVNVNTRIRDGRVDCAAM